MCEPISLSTMGMIASGASAAIGAIASIQQGNAAYAAGMYNAQVAERNAQLVENEKKNVQDEAAIERRRLGERVRAAAGGARVNAVAQGLDAEFGSPADLIGDIDQAYKIDQSILGRNEITNLERLDREQADYRDSATLSRANAKSARTAGFLGAAGSLMQGAATVSDKWIKTKKPDLETPAGKYALGSANTAATRDRLRVGGY